MHDNKIRVLAVGDPAVDIYVDKENDVLGLWKKISDIEVDFKIVPWESYYETMMEDFKAEESSFDIVMVAGHFWLKDFVRKGYIADLNDYLDYLPEHYDFEDILPVIRQEICLEGHQYLFPSFCDGHILLYRKSIVQNALGYLPDKCITIDELIDMVKKVDGCEGLHGIALKAHKSEILTDFLPYLRSEGTDLFDENLKPAFNNEKGIAALKKYKSLKKYSPENTCEFDNDAIREQMQQRKAAFAMTWGGQLGVVLDKRCREIEDIGFATIDKPWNVTWSFAVNKKSLNKEGAVKLLGFLTSSEVDKMVGRHAGSPVRKSTYMDEAERKKCSWYDAHLDMIENYAKPLPNLDNSGEIFGVLYDCLSRAFNDELSEEESLKIAESKIAAIMDIDNRSDLNE
jgi:multiple sugar transport system substrate-binding protein